MKVRFGASRGKIRTAIALATVVTSALSGSVSALADGSSIGSDHWGVITRNTIGSPVAALRDGPFGSYGVTGVYSRPPYGNGSLGIEVAGPPTVPTAQSEKVDFGNEVDFYGDRVRDLTKVGFRVFQPNENVLSGGPRNLPNIKFEIDPNLPPPSTDPYSTLVWVPDAVPTTNQWSPYLDATVTGTWFLTGGELGTDCSSASHCSFATLKSRLTALGAQPTIYSVSVGKGRDNNWAGAVDGLRINRYVYDFEADGVRARRVS